MSTSVMGDVELSRDGIEAKLRNAKLTMCSIEMQRKLPKTRTAGCAKRKKLAALEKRARTLKMQWVDTGAAHVSLRSRAIQTYADLQARVAVAGKWKSAAKVYAKRF